MAAFFLGGKLRIVFLERRQIRHTYTDILERHSLNQVETTASNKTISQFTLKKSHQKKWFEDNKIPKHNWTANSLDLNPMLYVFAIILHDIYRNKCQIVQ